MKVPGSIARLLALMLGTSFVIAHAEDKPQPPTEAELRATITRGLGYLAKGGDEWIAEKNCNSCHHMPQVLWNHREAKLRGFPVDEKKFDEWVAWTDGNTKAIGPGLESMGFLKLAMPGKPAPGLTNFIVKGQKPDGSWGPAGQFLGQKRPAPEVTANSSRLFLLALGANDVDKQVSDDARAKAAALLAKNDTPKSVETLAYRVLYERRFGTPENVSSIQNEIAKLQHPDGGWGWLIGEPASDSIATGLALLALQPSSDPSLAAAVTSAQRWLISQQKEDGGWPVDYSKISTTDRSKPEKAKSLKDATMIYSYWGTAWSTLGLLQAIPVSNSPKTNAPVSSTASAK